MVAVLLTVPLYTLFQSWGDPDFWWQSLAGQTIVAEQRLPGSDYFSFVTNGQAWVVHEWAADVVIGAVHRVSGLRGVLVFRAVMLLAAYAAAAVLLRRAAGRRDSWALAPLLALVAYAGSWSWSERPHLFSYLLFACFLLLARERGRSVWWCVPLTALWANLHGLFLVGIGVLALAALGAHVELRTARASRDWARRISIVSVASASAALLNPYGVGLYTHALRLTGAMRGRLDEWHSPDFSEPVPQLFLVLILLTMAAFAYWGRPTVTTILLVSAFVSLGLYAARNIALAAIVLGMAIAERIPTRPTRPAGASSLPDDTARRLNRLAFVGTLAGAIAVGAITFPTSEAAAWNRVQVPHRSFDHLAASDGAVRLVTTDEWAGAALYRAWPRVQVAFDTRWDLYGADGMEVYSQLLRGGEAASRWLGRHCVTHVLVPADVGVSDTLSRSAAWTRVEEETVAGDEPRTAVLYAADETVCGHSRGVTIPSR